MQFDDALFISDLHLAPAYPYTANRFLEFCENEARHTKALFILGDLFEFWVGDDAHLDTPFHQQIAKAIAKVVDSGIPVFFIAGNRDFILGESFHSLAKWQVLDDPYKVTIGGTDYVLSHGDLLCTRDWSYQLLRQFTRVTLFQRIYMWIPVGIRKKFAERLRKRAVHKYGQKAFYDHTVMDTKGDVTLKACAELTSEFACPNLIHGHTHKPGAQDEQWHHHYWRRWVLSDWDLDHPTMHPRANMLHINHRGVTVVDLVHA